MCSPETPETSGLFIFSGLIFQEQKENTGAWSRYDTIVSLICVDASHTTYKFYLENGGLATNGEQKPKVAIVLDCRKKLDPPVEKALLVNVALCNIFEGLSFEELCSKSVTYVFSFLYSMTVHNSTS
jgi:hypothetical protein